MMGFFEIGFGELFVQSGFEPRSSLLARITGMSHQCPAFKDTLIAESYTLK
jgi:hypothetical protein